MSTTLPDPMRLQLPTDRLILKKLLEGRNLAANIAAEIDRSRTYINQRMGHLYDYGLVSRVGPTESTGLYEITEKGQVALNLIDEFDSGSPQEFDELVERELNSDDESE
jgi:predicted transcriptional regulator